MFPATRRCPLRLFPVIAPTEVNHNFDLSLLISLPLLRYHIDGIIQYVFLCVWLLLLTITSLKFITALCVAVILFYCCIVSLYVIMPQFVHSILFRDWGCFLFWIINKVPRSFLCIPFTYEFIYLSVYVGVGLLSHSPGLCSALVDNFK